MRTGMFGMLAGLLFAARGEWAPGPALALALPLLLSVAVAVALLRARRGGLWWASVERRGRAVCAGMLGAAIGLCWGAFAIARVIAAELPEALIGEDLLLQGRVVGLVEERPAPGGRVALRFDVEVMHCQAPAEASVDCAALRRVRLSDYRGAQSHGGVEPGEHWRWSVRLRPPRGLANPGGRDAVRHLRAEGLGATGYIREGQRLSPASGLAAWRAGRARALAEALGERPAAPVLRALAVGERQALDDADWALFRDTGTVHLLVVSGLHIGLVGGLALTLMRLLLRSALTSRLGWRRIELAGAVVAVLIAALYALLAGFTLPTRRALLMFTVATGLWVSWRPANPGAGMLLAALAVLCWQPLAVWSAGFWLSFGAVAVILVVVLGERPTGRWRWWRVQWAACLGLVPALVLAGQPVTLLSLPANVVAIPLVSLWVVPLNLLALLMLPLSSGLAAGLWQGVETVLLPLLWFLALLRELGEPLVWQLPRPGLPALLLGVAGVAWLLLPRGWPGRWLGWLMLLPLWLGRPEPVLEGQWRAAVLDVGQGLAVVVETASHVLVYDTGPAWGEGSAGRSVVAPYLHWRGRRSIDLVMISHRHVDHSGGAADLLQTFPVQRVLGGEPVRGVAPASRCRAGQRWRWDGVDFEVLYPLRDDWPLNADDRSCVLRVSGGGHSLLLTGDISRSAESTLVRCCARALRSDVLVLPHHGSRSSSSVDFVTAVQPRFGMISSGDHNRFGHPHEEVLIRYRLAGTGLFNTADGGALLLTQEGQDLRVTPWRGR